jgi:hypothetical protein
MLSHAEKSILSWINGSCGTFHKKLFDCMTSADEINILRISEGFPEEVKVFRRFKSEKGFVDYLIRNSITIVV